MIEARNEATTILEALDKGRKNPAWGQLTGQERENIGKMEHALREIMKGEDYREIRAAIDALNQGTMNLAERMMDSAVSSALKGKSMDETDVGEGPASPHPIGKAEFK